MKNWFEQLARCLLSLIDFFYHPFKGFFTKQTFRYAASGGGNVVLGFLIYIFSYTFLFQGQPWVLPFYAFKPHSASLLMSFCVTFPVGFFMSKFVVFPDSDIKGRIQLFRYLMICLFNLLLNYLLLKLLVEHFYLSPVLSQVLTVLVVVTFSYLAQRNFSFKITAKLP
ncbi:MAG: GtrA family protein [Sphingomonadales bacterium]